MHRLDRRQRILRGKRQCAFNPEQRYFDGAARSRAARRVRVNLRRMIPIVLVAPRWSHVQRFLDDIATDLSVGGAPIRCRALSLHALQGRSTHQARMWLTQALTEFCGLVGDGPVAQAVDSAGFREVLGRVFRRSTLGPPRALLIHGVEHAPVEVSQDLLAAFEAHAEEAGDRRKVVILCSASIDAPGLEIAGSVRVVRSEEHTSELQSQR